MILVAVVIVENSMQALLRDTRYESVMHFFTLKVAGFKNCKNLSHSPSFTRIRENRSFRMLPNHKYMVDTEYYVSLVNFTAM